MSKELSVTNSFSELVQLATAISKSGLFGMNTPEQALALMSIAQAEGYSPALAARDYHLIGNKPTLKADAMLARFQQSGGKVEWHTYTDEKVSGTFSHPQGGSITVDWDMERARKAELLKNPTWRKYPRNMLRARVISEAIRTIYPGVGTVGIYTPEEMQDIQLEQQTKNNPKLVQTLKVSERRELTEQSEPKIDPEYLRKLVRLEAQERGLDLLKEKNNLISIYELLSQELNTFDDSYNMKRVKEEFEKTYAQKTEVLNAE